ncbi:hypothetical protein [Sphingomicrobium astaxanthinifaciens]|uniref:hypothetical protein n=1 Tax=Sphingomicrobium astaxanthinifaciens TaxID=1227949 RepID=UPI001FCBD739|nr:hypothetical protein [Sphingomicrobium astaxanthinifaciens]MCJ7420442.1 hypothetical protein [Sphingomicrobium astaxanthinifaciens]
MTPYKRWKTMLLFGSTVLAGPALAQDNFWEGGGAEGLKAGEDEAKLEILPQLVGNRDSQGRRWGVVGERHSTGAYIHYKRFAADKEEGYSLRVWADGRIEPLMRKGGSYSPFETPLIHQAARMASPELIDFVLANGADLHEAPEGVTALFVAYPDEGAIPDYRLATIDKLIALGLDPEAEIYFAPDERSYTAETWFMRWSDSAKASREQFAADRAAMRERRLRADEAHERAKEAERRRKAEAERRMWAGVAETIVQETARGAARIERASRPPRIPGAPTSRNERWERIREQGKQKARSEAIVEADIARARAKERRRDRVRSARKNASRDAAMRTEWFVDSPNCQFSDTYDDGRTKKTFMRQYEPAVYEVTSSSPRADYDEWRKGMLESIQRSFEQAHNLERREVASFGSYCKAETNYQASLSGALEALRDRNVQKESWLSSHRPRDDWTIFEWDPISIDLKGGKRIR